MNVFSRGVDEPVDQTHEGGNERWLRACGGWLGAQGAGGVMVALPGEKPSPVRHGRRQWLFFTHGSGLYVQNACTYMEAGSSVQLPLL